MFENNSTSTSISAEFIFKIWMIYFHSKWEISAFKNAVVTVSLNKIASFKHSRDWKNRTKCLKIIQHQLQYLWNLPKNYE